MAKKPSQQAAVKEPQEQSAFYERTSTTVLAQQPSDPTKAQPVTNVKWQVLQGHLEARIQQLYNWRESWWSQNWNNLAEYILPRRSIWLTQSTGGMPTPNNMTRGRQINNAIKDPTATFAARVCAAGLMSGLASVSRPWFKISPSMKGVELQADGRTYLDEVESRIYAVLAGSNFYNAFAQECEDLVVFGTGPNIIYEDEKDVIRCYNPAIGEYFLSVDGTLRVDLMARRFVMTITQMVSFFGLNNCPPDVQEAWKAKGAQIDVERVVAHVIEPNFDVAEAGKIPGNFSWREEYWCYGSASVIPLSQKGFVDAPFTAARWATQSNDAYGRSPGMDVLPDVIQLQVETVRKAEGIEKGLRPPLIADMAMKNQPSSILPGHVTYVPNLTAGSGMRSIYEINFDLNAISADIGLVQQRIKVGLFNDLFLMLEQYPTSKMTAYEVAQKIQEKLQVLGPVIENIITESLKPKLHRVYNIMKRKGMFPPLPDSMKGVPIDLEFVSMLALAQKASATGGMERIAALIGNMVAVFPEAKDSLNVDEYIAEMNSLLDNPQKILYGPEQIAERRQAQQQQQQAQQQQQEMAGAAQTASVGADAAKVLSDTQVGDGASALSMLMGQGGS